MRTNIITFFLFCITFINCNGNKGNNRADIEYQKSLKRFPNGMVDFFPKKLGVQYKTSKMFGPDKLVLFASYVFDYKENHPINNVNYLAKYCASDENLVVVKSPNLLDWDENKWKKYSYLQKNDTIYYPVLYIVPEDKSYISGDILELYSQDSECGLADHFDLYVLDSQQGNYWKGLEGVSYLPVEWKRGYSKGIYVSEKYRIAIYWIVIW